MYCSKLYFFERSRTWRLFIVAVTVTLFVNSHAGKEMVVGVEVSGSGSGSGSGTDVL